MHGTSAIPIVRPSLSCSTTTIGASTGPTKPNTGECNVHFVAPTRAIPVLVFWRRPKHRNAAAYIMQVALPVTVSTPQPLRHGPAKQRVVHGDVLAAAKHVYHWSLAASTNASCTELFT